MNDTSDTQELNKSLKKAIQQTKVTADYIRKRIEEKLVANGRGYMEL